MHFCQDCRQFIPGVCGGHPQPTVNPYMALTRRGRKGRNLQISLSALVANIRRWLKEKREWNRQHPVTSTYGTMVGNPLSEYAAELLCRQQIAASGYALMSDAEVNSAFGLDEEQSEPIPFKATLVAAQVDVPALIEVIIPLQAEAR